MPYLGYRSREDDNLVQFPDPFHELINTGAFYHVNVVIVPLDFHGNGEIGLVEYLCTSQPLYPLRYRFEKVHTLKEL